MPEEWRKSVLVSFFKNKDNYGGIEVNELKEQHRCNFLFAIKFREDQKKLHFFGFRESL